MNLKLFLTGDKFGLLIDLRSMADRTMHGSGVHLVNTTDSVQLELVRTGTQLPGLCDLRLSVQPHGQPA